jgi:CheY-like chemotaxis protein
MNPTEKEILIVEDNEANRAAAAKIFPEATLASSAKEALEVLASKPKGFPIIITDLQMETPMAGAEVFAEGIQTGRETLMATATGEHHGTEVITILPCNLQIDRLGSPNPKEGKTSTDPWEVCRKIIAREEIDPELVKGTHYFQKYPDRREETKRAVQRAIQYHNRLMQSVERLKTKREPLAITLRVFISGLVKTQADKEDYLRIIQKWEEKEAKWKQNQKVTEPEM